MPAPPELPPRPEPPRRAVDVAAGWVRWFGLGRLVAGAVSVAIVVAGAAWLLRPPAPATEAALPVAGAGGRAPATLAPPSSPPPMSAAAPSSSVPVPASIVVHVAGAVIAPGVLSLASGARVADAVVAAGGVAPDGDLDGINLAAPLGDGQRVYVPRIGEVDPAAVPSGAWAGDASATGPVGTSPPAGPVDLNVADATALEALPGVGPSTATAIVDDRDRNGPFASVDDLDRVPGIGPAKLASLRDLVTV
jgi:competence protein ComEA